MKRVSNLPCLAKLLLVLLTTTTGTAEQCEFCNSRWRKIYEVDDKGAAVFGSYDELLAAVKRAEPLRYLIPSLGVEGYAGNCDQTHPSRGPIIFVSTSYVSKSSWKTFEEEPYHRLLRMTTTGAILENRFNVNNFTQIKYIEYKAGVQWFVKKSSCISLLLEHTGRGEVINGSLEKVISSVVSGHDIIETWVNMYTEPFRNIKVTEEGMVVGQFVWDITMRPTPHWSFMDVYTSGFALRNSYIPGQTYILLWKMQPKGKWYADSCWRHVFTNDENGNRVDGSLTELISAVKRGNRVKVVMGNFSIEADSVRTKSGQISAQLLNRLYREKVDRKYRGFWYWQMAHTTGTVATLKYSLFNGTSVGEETERKTIKWFVDTKPWKTVLSTKKNGDIISGSKADLSSAVENGADVRVALQIDSSKPASNTPRKRFVDWWEMGGHGGWLWNIHSGSGGRHRSSYDCPKQEWTFFKTSNLELGPSGEVSAELLQSVSTEEVGSKEFKIKEQASWKYMIVTTQGDVDIFQSGIGVHNKQGHFSVKHAMKWFVNY